MNRNLLAYSPMLKCNTYLKKTISKISSGQRRQKEGSATQKILCIYGTYYYGQTPESGIPPSHRATRRYTKVHLGLCLRFSTLIGQIGRVPLFGAGPRRYIRSRLFRLAVTAFWRAFTACWRQKGKRKQIFPRAVRTTELPSNPSPLTFISE